MREIIYRLVEVKKEVAKLLLRTLMYPTLAPVSAALHSEGQVRLKVAESRVI